MKKIETLKPFKYFCMTIGALPTSYIDSMSYYETLCWLCKYLENTVIPAVNNNGEAVEELQQKYLELVDYVNNYFDNLDYQTEVNAKLDEMADDGTLAQIINVEMIGSLQDLTTTDKTDLVSAINEVNANIGNIPAIGDLTDLTTTDKTDLVSAINEVNTNTGTNASNITANNTAINNKVGDLTNLTTTNKTNIVSAINEVNTGINIINSNFATVTGVYQSDGTVSSANLTLQYPQGFTKSNTYVINVSKLVPNKTNIYVGSLGTGSDYIARNPGTSITLADDHITLNIATIYYDVIPEYNLAAGDYTFTLLLMKIDE